LGTFAKATRGNAKLLIDQTVAVIVFSVTYFRSGAQQRVAALDLTVDAVD
jgi:hypothetical protein